ncbi:Sec-independent protein translocase subunit TatA/TatB [Haloarchaeobius amylolyticus]|uniref:Sec-independent protein translocase subunit TatA/TatB n=1 Tax=Haloarchaeobius amylolyticus TaxID=1198296 RepID=UPI0022703400|nr:twin-arginine translocase TatA/TatE family subunit [Haloarchaeobius amylolyticus]
MTIPLFIGGIGGPELIVVFLLVILLFGADKLPKLARASGEAMGEFQKGREEIERELEESKSKAMGTETETAEVETEDVEKETETDSDASPA